MTDEGGIGRGIVLVVDDSPDTLGVVIEALEGAGMTTLVARDGPAALDLLGRIEPDLILLDAMMPGIDGFETCRRIKALAPFVTTPVVFMTGLSDRRHVAEALKAGGVDYVAKPVAPDELIARISVHVVNARMIADARRALDDAGRSVAALSAAGALRWSTPKAGRLLSPLLGDAEAADRVSDWVAAGHAAALSETPDLEIAPPAGGALRLSMIGRSGAGAMLVRVTEVAGASPVAVLSQALGVTEREAEVLGWLARGKSNRDIADILGLSPRTVTKHVEQIFAKMGVENRTAAAAAAVRLLAS